jgi:hypothetical protein
LDVGPALWTASCSSAAGKFFFVKRWMLNNIRRAAPSIGRIVGIQSVWAAGTVDAPDEELKSELVVKVVLPVLSSAEQECGQALSRISLADMARAALNGHGTEHHESGEPRGDL